MVPPVGSVVWIERRKWPDRRHYGAQGIVLGTDDHGVWCGAPGGNLMYAPTGETRRGSYELVWCLPPEGGFMVHRVVGHPEMDVYIDIATPATWSESGARLVDLDFDVIVWNDGRPVELVDEDEFEEHRVSLAYPEALVAQAREWATSVFAAARDGAPPFNPGAADPWLDALRDHEPVYPTLQEGMPQA